MKARTIVVALGERFPRVELSVEEDTPQVESFSRNCSPCCVVIDPIDGTRGLMYDKRFTDHHRPRECSTFPEVA